MSATTTEQVLKSDQKKKNRLIRIMGEKCCICGYDKCNAALEFHHKDPNEKEFTISDNAHIALEKAIEEVKKCILVCANCHREIHAGLIDISNIECFNEEIAKKEIEENNEIKFGKKYFCIDCGEEVKRGVKRCPKCAELANRKVKERPTREELKNLIRTKTFVEIGSMYGVTDGSIKKWCDSVNLPRRKKDINVISDEDWELI